MLYSGVLNVGCIITLNIMATTDSGKNSSRQPFRLLIKRGKLNESEQVQTYRSPDACKLHPKDKRAEELRGIMKTLSENTKLTSDNILSMAFSKSIECPFKDCMDENNECVHLDGTGTCDDIKEAPKDVSSWCSSIKTFYLFMRKEFPKLTEWLTKE